MDLRPDLFQALHLLQEADHQAALQPWADGVHSTATQEVRCNRLDERRGLGESFRGAEHVRVSSKSPPSKHLLPASQPQGL